MPWYQVLPLGVLGGLIVGGFFYALGWWLDRRDAARWRREMEDVSSSSIDAAEALEDLRRALDLGRIKFPQQLKSEESDPDGAN